jgi:hypothetical protein
MKTKFYKLLPLLSLVLVFLGLAACSNDENTDASIEDTGYELSALGNKPVALVGKTPISRAQLDHALAFYSTNPMVNAEEGRIKLLNDMIEEQVMYNKAMEKGFDKSPEFINNQRKLLAYEYKKYLKQKVAESTKITDVDLQIFYEKSIEKYSKPAMLRFAIFVVRDDLPKKSKYSLKQISDAVQYLKPEQGFDKYALDSHHSHTANRGGKLPWLNSNSQLAGIPHELIEQAQDLDIGEVSKAIEIENKIYLVRLMAKKEKSITPLAEMKSSLRQQLLIERKQSLLNNFVNQAKQSSKIEIFKENLNSKAGKPRVNTATDSVGPPGFPVSQ